VFRDIERQFTKISSKVAYTRSTIVSLDDDQYRIQSALSEELGLVRINNPKKAFGPVSTNAVSAVSGIILGMRLLRRGENLQQVVQIVLQWMHDVDSTDFIDGQGVHVCLDRGYLTPLLIDFLVNRGFNVAGTHKKIRSFAFTFNNFVNQASQRIVSEKGAKSLYFAKRRVGQRFVYAIVYRTGKGRAATLITTTPCLNTWVYTPKRSYQHMENNTHPLIAQTIDQHTTVATTAQGGCEWHFSRVGIVTSTVAIKLLSVCVPLCTEVEQIFLRSLGINTQRQSMPANILRQKSIEQLKQILQDFNIPSSNLRRKVNL
jgi:hypothetical protein